MLFQTKTFGGGEGLLRTGGWFGCNRRVLSNHIVGNPIFIT